MEDVEFLNYKLPSKADMVGAQIGDDDANIVMYGLRCHSLLLKNYKKYVPSNNSEQTEHNVNSQTIYCLYGKIPKHVYNVRNTYLHIKDCLGKEIALEWLAAYIPTISPCKYENIVNKAYEYPQFLTRLANIRFNKRMIPKALDIISTGRLTNSHAFIDECIDTCKSDNTKIMLQHLIRGMESYKLQEERKLLKEKLVRDDKNDKKHYIIRKIITLGSKRKH
jgi:hypothetical protein